MKKIFAMLLAMLFVSSSALAGAMEYALVYNPNITDMLNLRQDPSTESKSLGKYHTGYVPRESIVGGALFAQEENQGGYSSMPAEHPVTAVPVRELLMTGDGEYEITNPEKLHTLYKLLTSLDEWGENIAGCLFGANLLLEFPDDVTVVELATDGCNILRYNNHDFRYAFDLWQQDEGTTSAVLFDLFGVSP